MSGSKISESAFVSHEGRDVVCPLLGSRFAELTER